MYRRKRPFGIQTFLEIRVDDYYYVDKTVLASQLVNEGSLYSPHASAVSASCCSSIRWVSW